MFTAVLKYWFKFFATSLSSVTVFLSSTKETVVSHNFFSGWKKNCKRRGLTVFQKSILSVILFQSRLLKDFFLSLLYSLLQKFLCHLKSFTFSLDLILKYLCCSCILFIIAFLIVFVTYGAWLALIVLFLIRACLPKTLTKKIQKHSMMECLWFLKNLLDQFYIFLH